MKMSSKNPNDEKFINYDTFKSCVEIEIDRGKETCHLPYFVIMKEKTDDIMIQLTNFDNELESYTTHISPEEFKVLKKNQRLAFQFNAFAMQLIELFKDGSQRKLTIKMIIDDDDVVLEFITSNHFREIPYLSLNLHPTPVGELLEYFKSKAEDLQDKLRMAQSELSSQNVQIRELYEYRQRYRNICQEKTKMSDEFAAEKESLQEKIQELNNNLSLCNKNYSKAVNENVALRNEIEKNKVHENNLLKCIKQLEENTVPIEKYEKVKALLSKSITESYVAEIKLSTIIGNSERVKSENKKLKHFVQTSVESLQEYRNNLIKLCEKDNILENIKSGNKDVQDQLLQIQEKLEFMGFQNISED